MTITLCNSHPFTFYLPFHTSLRADQCPIQSHVPSTCTLGLDPCARHSLFGRTDPYYIDNFYSSCGLKRLAATLASPFSVIVLSSQYLFQRGPIWIACSQKQYLPVKPSMKMYYHEVSLRSSKPAQGDCKKVASDLGLDDGFPHVHPLSSTTRFQHTHLIAKYSQNAILRKSRNALKMI